MASYGIAKPTTEGMVLCPVRRDYDVHVALTYAPTQEDADASDEAWQVIRDDIQQSETEAEKGYLRHLDVIWYHEADYYEHTTDFSSPAYYCLRFGLDEEISRTVIRFFKGLSIPERKLKMMEVNEIRPAGLLQIPTIPNFEIDQSYDHWYSAYTAQMNREIATPVPDQWYVQVMKSHTKKYKGYIRDMTQLVNVLKRLGAGDGSISRVQRILDRHLQCPAAAPDDTAFPINDPWAQQALVKRLFEAIVNLDDILEAAKPITAANPNAGTKSKYKPVNLPTPEGKVWDSVVRAVYCLDDLKLELLAWELLLEVYDDHIGNSSLSLYKKDWSEEAAPFQSFKDQFDLVVAAYHCSKAAVNNSMGTSLRTRICHAPSKELNVKIEYLRNNAIKGRSVQAGRAALSAAAAGGDDEDEADVDTQGHSEAVAGALRDAAERKRAKKRKRREVDDDEEDQDQAGNDGQEEAEESEQLAEEQEDPELWGQPKDLS